MNGVKYLVGTEETINLPLVAYCQETIDFLGSLSHALMELPESRAFPDLMAAAFWCRRGNLMKRKEAYPDAAFRLGRGLAFHIAPSNIPMNFAFSWFFSLLAGNANIVRLPSKRFPQAAAFCETVKRLLPGHPEIEKRTAFVTYPVDDEITAAFCAKADARIIWGGNDTIAAVSRHPTKPRCVDVTFADRYSVCILDGEVIAKSDERELKRLAKGFYNDTYLMDQNACSSPQLILWTNDSSTAREHFWNAVAEYAVARYDLQDMTAVDKYTRLCEDAIDGKTAQKAVRQNGNLLYRVGLTKLPESGDTSLRGKGGYFYEYSLDSLKELCAVVDEQYQTVVCYGVPAEDLRRLVLENRLRGIDRIVPVGSAMDIDIIWDGYDIVRILSRVVSAS